MLSTSYRLVEPKRFEPVQVSLPTTDSVLVQPTYLSICNADQRYYQGKRDPQVLVRKLPMALIHEAIGRVAYDDTGTFERGQRVVLVPNVAEEENPCIAENYLLSSKFCGSGTDGFLQEVVALDKTRAIPVPDSVPDEVAAFTELVSVASHAIDRFDAIAHGDRSRIGVWGDGNLGFIVALLLTAKFPDTQVVVFGRNQHKLNDFSFLTETHIAGSGDALPVDHVFECCGGTGSVSAIQEAIGLIKPEGTIALLGVSENDVPIETRMVLEKGLRLFGSSRSGRSDFRNVVDLYAANPHIVSYLQTLVGNVVDVNTVDDIASAFELDMVKRSGKTILKWNI